MIFIPTKPILASASRDGSARIWNVETGKCDKVIKLTSDLRCVRFDESGERLAACGYRSCVRVLDVEDDFSVAFDLQTEIGKAGSINSGAYYQVDFSPNGKELLGISSNGNAEVWDLKSGEKVMSHSLHEKYGSDCRWIDSTHFITTSSSGRDIKVWDRDAFQVPRLAFPFGANAAAAEFSPDGSLALVGAQRNDSRGGYVDKRLRMYDTRSMQVRLELIGHEGWPTCTTFAEDGRIVASGDDQGVVIVWNVATGERTKSISHEGRAVVDLAIIDDTLSTVTANGLVQRWSLANSNSVRAPYQLPVAAITSAQIVPSRDELLVTDKESINVCRLADGSIVERIELPTDGDELANDLDRTQTASDGWIVQLDPSGRWIVAARGDRIWYWDRQSEAGSVSEARLVQSNGGDVRAVAFTHDGSRLASTHADSSVRIWNLDRGAQVLALRGQLGHRGSLSTIAFSRNDALLIAGRTQLALWDATPASESADVASSSDSSAE